MSGIPVVLYAEDDENDTFFMERAFAKQLCGDALRVVPNGRQAMDYLTGRGGFSDRQRHPLPAVVILDVKMPELSGIETLARIRARPEWDALPVVMFTSSTQDSDIASSRKHGANAYIVKPSNADNLWEIVAGVLSARHGLSPSTRRLAVSGNVL